MSSKKIWAIANIVGLAATIVVSWLSSTGVFNGETMATMSAKYPTLITPAPYAFGIWGLIYLSLIGFVVYGGAVKFSGTRPPDDPAVLRVGGWFFASCMANCGWVLSLLYGNTELSLMFMLVLLVSLFRIAVLTDMELTDPPVEGHCLRVVAFLLLYGVDHGGFAGQSIGVLFVKAAGKPFFVLHEAGWAVGMLVVAGPAPILC